MDLDKQIMKHFEDLQSWEERYKKIIFLGKNLPLFLEEHKTEQSLISECQSQLWLRAEYNDKKQVVFTGDSESLISKGLLALMIEYCSFQSPQKILELKFTFIEELNLTQYLSMKRTNGFQSIIKQIRNYAKAFYLLSQ